jgi:hypothetical protein
MKQLTKNLLKLNFRGIDLNTVSKIEFAFSQDIGEPPLKVATYPSTNAMLVLDNMIGVVWTEEDTALFEAGKPFYADTRITLSDSEYQPETPIVKLKMNPTLFERG